MNPQRVFVQLIASIVVLLVSVYSYSAEAKLLRQHLFDDSYSGAYDRPYASGQRALITVGGARNTYDGRAPSKLIIEDQPWGSGLAPSRGIYDRLDVPRGPRMPLYPAGGYGGMGGYGGPGGYGYSPYGPQG